MLHCTGELAHNYRKLNLWGEWENGVFARGSSEGLVCFDLVYDAATGASCRTGAIICFDVEFPEPARELARPILLFIQLSH